MTKPLALLLALLLTAPAAAFADLPDEFLATVAVSGRADVERLADFGTDIAEVRDGLVTIVTRERDLPGLEAAGFKVTRTREGAAELRARFAGKATAADAGLYHTYAETVAELEGFAKAHPKIATVESIGKSFEKRDVPALRISGAKPGARVPKMLVMGLHHSREWITVEVPLAFAKTLLEGYGKDERITKLVDNRVVYIVPIVNPDGYIWSQTQYSYWRKNRNDNNGNPSKGVDPNRNYGYQWGMAGSSDSPSSDTYHGTGPFSEPCTQNIKRLAERERFVVDISFHSYGELILFPWSYAYNQHNPDRAVFEKLGKEMAAFNKYKCQESCNLYPSMGDTDDFLYGQCASLSYTFELAKQFIPAESQIQSICDQNVPAMLHMLEQAGAVHAQAHPDYASALAFRAHQLGYLAGAAACVRERGGEAGEKALLSALDTTRHAMLDLVRPEADPDGAAFRELAELTRAMQPSGREALRPVLESLRALCLDAQAAGRAKASLAGRVETLDALLAGK